MVHSTAIKKKISANWKYLKENSDTQKCNKKRNEYKKFFCSCVRKKFLLNLKLKIIFASLVQTLIYRWQFHVHFSPNSFLFLWWSSFKTATEKRETCIFHKDLWYTCFFYICNIIKLYHLYSFRIRFTQFSFLKNRLNKTGTRHDDAQLHQLRKKYLFLTRVWTVVMQTITYSSFFW